MDVMLVDYEGLGDDSEPFVDGFGKLLVAFWEELVQLFFWNRMVDNPCWKVFEVLLTFPCRFLPAVCMDGDLVDVRLG